MKKFEPAIIGVFEGVGDARRAIEDLRAANISARNIGILTHDKDGDPDVRSFKELEGDKARTGALAGAAAGAGGGALWALGIAVGLLPAIGPVIGGGLLAAVAASAGAGAAGGVIAGALVGLGIGDEEAAYYDEEFKKGRTVVLVQAGSRAQLVSSIFTAHNSRNTYRGVAGVPVKPTGTG